MKIIDNTKIISPFIEVGDGFIVIMGKKIHYIGDKTKDKNEYNYFVNNASEIIDFKKKISVPGFIDIHTHGSLGKDYSNTPELLIDDSIFRATKGVVGFLPTIGAMVKSDEILNSAVKIMNLMEKDIKGAKSLGINLEGPFLNPSTGSQGPDFCFWEVDLKYLENAKKLLGDKIKIVTISPELENAIEGIVYLRENDIVPSIGHTQANEELLDKAIRAGAKLVTHLLNTTYQPEQNIKGVIISGVNEYLLTRDDIMAEAICDIKGIHINPTMLKIFLKCKGIEKTIIITDSYITPGCGKNKKFNMPNGIEFYAKNGVNFQSESGHITGSAMTMDLSVRSMMKHTGIGLKEAILMSSFNAAKIIDIHHKKGSIEVGKDADIIAIDEKINIFATIVEGEMVYNRL